MLLLLVLPILVNADTKTLALIESFNLKTTGDPGITCPAVQQVYIESGTAPFLCTGDIKDAAKGMSIGIQAKPLTREGTAAITWLIVTAVGNLTSTMEVNDHMEEQQSATMQIDFTPTAQPVTTSIPPNSTKVTTAHPPTTVAHLTTVATTEAHQTTVQTNEAAGPPAKLEATPSKVTVTVNYIQFQTGVVQEVNKNTAAVVFAVLEGLILGAILIVFIMRRRAQAQLRAAMYPNPPDYQSNTNTNTAQYGNGMGYQNSQIPSYRNADPPMRLDSLPPRTQQPTASPTLMPVTTPPAASHITPAPLNYWPDEPGQGQPVKNIMDSDM
ncbi:unnamed protein product [Cylicocyclus nassatus]|uniref:Uncharacterized protein n=1 Tax=Cylicocyclus nassatus TaxID=53992 RepID=A0AA36M3W0_CYLNA|nr:unnamed protein product [Cylicocyclus nassatus]